MLMSRFLRSGCCGWPVVQALEPMADLLPIRCIGCWQELAAPGREDVPERGLDEERRFARFIGFDT